MTFTDEHGNLWFEEYIVSPPTHILNGFMWAAWGVYDYFLATGDPTAQAFSARRCRLCWKIWSTTIWDSGLFMSNPERA